MAGFGDDSTIQTLLTMAMKSSSSGSGKRYYNVLNDKAPKDPYNVTTADVVADISTQPNGDKTKDGLLKHQILYLREGRLEIFRTDQGLSTYMLQRFNGEMIPAYENKFGIIYFLNKNHIKYPNTEVPQAIAYKNGTPFPSSKVMADGTHCPEPVNASADPSCAGVIAKRAANSPMARMQQANSPIMRTYKCLFGNIFSMVGQQIFYYPLSEYDEERDPIFGEDTEKAYYEKYTIMGLVEDATEEEIMYNEFGLTNADTGFRFKVLMSIMDSTLGREPIPGDQFIYSKSGHAYEVVHVSTLENTIMGSRMVYTIIGKSRTISGEIYGKECNTIEDVAINKSINDALNIIEQPKNVKNFKIEL